MGFSFFGNVPTFIGNQNLLGISNSLAVSEHLVGRETSTKNEDKDEGWLFFFNL